MLTLYTSNKKNKSQQIEKQKHENERNIFRVCEDFYYYGVLLEVKAEKIQRLFPRLFSEIFFWRKKKRVRFKICIY
jgi:hypothetical protein